MGGLDREKHRRLSWLCPYLALPVFAMGLHSASRPTADTSGQVGCMCTSRTKPMFSDAWSTFVSFGHVLAQKPICKPWWYQQTLLHMFRPCCRTSAAKGPSQPHGSRCQDSTASVTAHRPAWHMPGCRPELEQSAGRGHRAPLSPFLPHWTLRQNSR